MSKAQRNGAGRRDPEKLKRQKRRDRKKVSVYSIEQ